MTQTRLPVYIGYDSREHAAALVCASTVRQPIRWWETDMRDPQGRLAVPFFLKHRELRLQGLFNRPWSFDTSGQPYDVRDGKPFSTEFSHSRFLVPYIAKQVYGESGWVAFVDCDFMFRCDIAKLLDEVTPDMAIACVKVDAGQVVEGTKMDGVAQTVYPRKLWSSLMLWNLDHPANQMFVNSLTPANELPGGVLHRMEWIDRAREDLIGALDPTWNTIPGVTPDFARPRALHWSQGGPWMKGYEDAPGAGEWRARLDEVISQHLRRQDLSFMWEVE